MKILAAALLFPLAGIAAAAEVASATIPAPTFPQEHSTLVPDPLVTFGKLDNGLRWCVMPNQQPKDKVTIRLQVENGSLEETDAQRGLAHYLEHMAFNGSTHFPPGKLVALLQGMGLAFGAHTNAHTSFDETVYKLDLPDAKDETLATGLQVMADWGGELLILPEQVDRERGVILAEMRDRNSPGFREFVAEERAAYPGMIMGERAPIGVAETIDKADAALLRSYYDQWYRPEQMILTVVGAIDPAHVQEAIKTIFSPVKDRLPAQPRPSLGTLHPGLDFLSHHEAEDDSTTVLIELARPKVHPHDSPELRKLYLLQELAEAVFDRRISDLAEADPQGPILSGGMGSQQWLDIFNAEVKAQARPGRALDALHVIAVEQRRMLEFGPTAEELAIAVTSLRTQIDSAVAQAGVRANPALANALYTSVHDDQVFMSPEQMRANVTPMLDAAKVEDVIAAEHEAWTMDGAHLLVSVIGRDDLGDAGLAAVTQAYQSAQSEHLDPPVKRSAAHWAYGNIADTGAISHDRLAGDDIRELEFANHARANIKHTDFQPNQVLIQLRLEVAPEPREPGLSDLLTRAFMAGGLGKHSAQELREIYASSSVNVNGPGFSEDAAVFNATCLPKDIEMALQSLRAYVVDPGWRSEAEIRAKAGWIEELASIETDLDGQVHRTFTTAAVSNAPQRRPVMIDEAKAMTFGKVTPWFRPILETAPMTLSICGDIDVDKTVALAKHYIGSLGERRELRVLSDPRAPGALAPSPGLPSTMHRLEVPGTNPRGLVMVAWPTDDFYDVKQLRRLQLLADAMTERLRIKVREELGQAYSPYAYRDSSETYSHFGYLAAIVGVAPERVEDAHAAILDIAADLAAHGIDDELLSRIKVPIVKNLASYRQKNSYWLGSVLSRCQAQPFRIEWADTMEADYAAITAQDISALAAKFLLNDKVLQVIGVCHGAAGGKPPAVEPATVTP